MEFFETRGEVRTLNDETRTIIARVYRLGGAGDYGQILVATSDITQLTLTEEALRRSQKMDAIGQITGGIAHDFNNILGIIISNLDLLRLQLSGEKTGQKRVDTAGSRDARGRPDQAAAWILQATEVRRTNRPISTNPCARCAI